MLGGEDVSIVAGASGRALHKRRLVQAAATSMLVAGGFGPFALPVRAAEPFPSLAVVVERARTRPASVIVARGAERSAEALGLSARLSSFGNPYLEVFADRFASRQPSELAVQGNLWLPVDISGQRERRIIENGRLIAWRGAETAVVSSESVARLTERYGAAVVAAERVRFLETIVAISGEEAALYEARLRASDATVRDAKLAAVDLSRNRMALGQARADLSRALADVARGTGLASLGPPERDQTPPATLWDIAAVQPRQVIEEGPALKSLGQEAAYFAALQARDAVEGHAPLNVILSAGQGAGGGARLGGGLAWTFPIVRRNQGERARAALEEARARDVATALRGELMAALEGLLEERRQVVGALDELRSHGEPAAQAAVEAARATERAGKGELLHVVTARRDLVSVRASGLALEERQWRLLGELISLTGRSP
jgi:cobalt-zinc-cadmium efflux system outer membrane protein